MKHVGKAAIMALLVVLVLSTSCQKNQAPSTPATPVGPENGITSIGDAFTFAATDPDGDSVQFVIDWATGYYDTTEFVASGASLTVHHTWTTAGTFEVKVLALDKQGFASQDWSSTHAISITGETDHGPVRPPAPSGPTEGNRRTPYIFSDQTTDPDGDSVSYRFRQREVFLGDWSDYVPSGTMSAFQASFNTVGTFDVECQARDTHGHISTWSPALRITIF
jgi:hypothetical protein